MSYRKALGEVFAQNRYKYVLLILFLVLVPVFAITSDVIVTSTLTLNPTSEPLQIALMFGIVLLMALNGAVVFHNYETRKVSNKSTTLVGAVTALFTSTCPICQPVWLVWLGFGSASAFLASISLYLGLLSLAFLLVSLHYSLKSVSNTCEAK